MDKTLRSILWVLVALVVLSSLSTGWFFVAKERLYSDYLELEGLFKTNMERLNREIAASNKENEELKSRLAVIQRELEITEARNEELKSHYDTLLEDRDDLNKELARVKKGKFYLEKKVKEMGSNIFVADLFKEKASLEVELKRLKESVVPKDVEMDRLKTENMDLGIKLSRLEEEKELLEQRIRNSDEVAEVLSRDLLKEKNKSEGTKQTLEDIEIRNRVLKTRISELEKTSDRYKRLLAENEDMKFKIAGLERDLGYRDREIERIKTALEDSKSRAEWRAEAYHAPAEVELPPIVVDSTGYTSSTSSLERITREAAIEGRRRGRIVTVNREHNFVVIDLGKENGVDLGMTFKVYREDSYVGSIEAIQTRERIAACDIKDLEEGFFVEIDDLVVR